MSNKIKKSALWLFLFLFAGAVLYSLLFRPNSDPAKTIYLIQAGALIYLIIIISSLETERNNLIKKTSSEIFWSSSEAIKNISLVFFHEKRIKEFYNPVMDILDELKKGFDKQTFSFEAIDINSKKLYQFLKHTSYLGSPRFIEIVGPMLLDISRLKFGDPNKNSEYMGKAYGAALHIEAIVKGERERIQRTMTEILKSNCGPVTDEISGFDLYN